MQRLNNIYKPILNYIDRKETMRYAGLRQSIEFSEKLIDEAWNIVMVLKEPQTVWNIYPYDFKNGLVQFPADYLITSESLRKHLCHARQVIFLAATVGESVEKAASEAFDKGEYTLGLLIDAAATAAVEQSANELEKLLKSKFAKQGLKMTFRFSPGYGDWDLSEQKTVAALAEAEAIGITLTESLMLIPRKSITAVIGLCPDINEEATAKGCMNCSKLDCTMRREG